MFTITSLLIINLFRVSWCDCRQSYMTICDTFKDLENYQDKENLQELIIGSEQANLSSVHLMNTLNLRKYPKLTTLIVLGRINQLELTYAYECTYYNPLLQYVSFYGNEMKVIEEYHFPVHPMRKMSLVNNKIEAIKDGAFTHHQIVEFDVSDNLMEVVEKEALPMTNFTKTIIIRRNRLSHVEEKALPSTLQVLNLDHNNFRYIVDEVLLALTDLQEFTLSHNKFNQIPTISHMQKLVVFDISSNAIKTIPKDTFTTMPKLQYVDLSNNQIFSESVLSTVIIPRSNPLTVSLAMNRLRYLNLTGIPLDKVTLVLHGNPWDCNIHSQLKQQLQGHESKCDLEFLSSGRAPFCINYMAGNYVFTSLWENDINRFHDTVRPSTKNVSCKLNPDRNHILHPSPYGCVA